MRHLNIPNHYDDHIDNYKKRINCWNQLTMNSGVCEQAVEDTEHRRCLSLLTCGHCLCHPPLLQL